MFSTHLLLLPKTCHSAFSSLCTIPFSLPHTQTSSALSVSEPAAYKLHLLINQKINSSRGCWQDTARSANSPCNLSFSEALINHVLSPDLKQQLKALPLRPNWLKLASKHRTYCNRLRKRPNIFFLNQTKPSDGKINKAWKNIWIQRRQAWKESESIWKLKQYMKGIKTWLSLSQKSLWSQEI